MKKYIVPFVMMMLLVNVALAFNKSQFVAQYNLDNDVTDSWRNYDGTNHGAVANRTGYLNNAYAFNGSTYVDIPDGVINNHSFTLSMWVNANSSASETRIIGSSVGCRLYLGQKNGNYYYRAGDSGSQEGTAFPTDSWIHLVLTYNQAAGSLNLYVNGTKNHGVAGVGFCDPNALAIGVYNEGESQYFNGTIDEVTIWNRSMDVTEIRQLYDIYVAQYRPSQQLTYYIDSIAGDDSNTGLSSSEPLAQINETNALDLEAGDALLFKVGREYSGFYHDYIVLDNGNESGYVKYGTYGGDGEAIYTAGINMSNTGNWSLCNTSVWCSVHNFSTQIGNIIVNSGTAALNRSNSTLLPLNLQGQWYHNYTVGANDDKVAIYSSVNPATYYNNIILAEYNTLAQIQDKSYVWLENISFRYSSRGAIGQNDNANRVHHLIVSNCSAYWIGGGYLSDHEYDRTGNAFSFSNNVDNITVADNYIEQVWDSGLAVTEWTGSGDGGRILFLYNIVNKAGFGLEFFSTDYNFTNVTITHNTFVNSGWGFSGKASRIGSQGQGDLDGKGMYIKRCPAGCNKFVVKDNLVVNSSHSHLDYNLSGAWKGNPIDIDYNYYWYNTSNEAGKFSKYSDVTYASLASVQAALSIMPNSYEETVILNVNYAPQNGSYACNGSTTGAFIGALPCYTPSPPTPAAASTSLDTTKATNILIVAIVAVMVMGLLFKYNSDVTVLRVLVVLIGIAAFIYVLYQLI